MNPETSKSIAAGFALSGFAVAIVSGLAAGNPVTRTLQCALVSMLGCYLAGLAIAAVATRVAADHIASYKSAHPLHGAGSAAADHHSSSTSARTP